MKETLDISRASGIEIVYETETGGRKDVSFAISLAPHTELSRVGSVVEGIEGLGYSLCHIPQFVRLILLFGFLPQSFSISG